MPLLPATRTLYLRHGAGARGMAVGQNRQEQLHSPEVDALVSRALIAVRKEDSVLFWFDHRLDRRTLAGGPIRCGGRRLRCEGAASGHGVRVRPEPGESLKAIDETVQALRGRVPLVELR